MAILRIVLVPMYHSLFENLSFIRQKTHVTVNELGQRAIGRTKHRTTIIQALYDCQPKRFMPSDRKNQTFGAIKPSYFSSPPTIPLKVTLSEKVNLTPIFILNRTPPS